MFLSGLYEYDAACCALLSMVSAIEVLHAHMGDTQQPLIMMMHVISMAVKPCLNRIYASAGITG
jgi:DNA topoisomerase VI subunit B